MRKTDPNPIPNISLFPFLSVLLCVIGVLALMVTLLSVSHAMAAARDEADQEKTEQYVDLQSAIEQHQAKIEQYREQIARAKALKERIEELEKELAHLRQRAKEREAQAAAARESIRDLAETRRRIETARARLAKLDASFEALKEEVNHLPEAGTARIAPQRRFTGLDEDDQAAPIFIECVGDALIFHADGTRVLRDEIEDSSKLADVIERAQPGSESNERIVFLIRTDGVPVFDIARRVVRNAEVRHGFAPIPGDGPVDLSEFPQKKK